MSDNALTVIVLIVGVIVFALLVEADNGAVSAIIRAFRGKK